MNVIIPGFAVTGELFSDFLKLIPGTNFIPNASNKYEETKARLDDLSETYGTLNLFGWSLGSLFVLKWAVENPAKVKSIFLTGATARFCEKPGYENGIMEIKLKQMVRLVRIKPAAVMTDFYSTILEMTADREKYLNILIKNMPGTESLLNGLDELAKIDMLEHAQNIEQPVFIIHGKNDSITPLKGAEHLNGLLKNSTLEAIEGGHSIFLEKPETCAASWKDFLCTIN